MGLLLQVLGVVFLLLVVFVVAIGLTVRIKLRGFVKTLQTLSKTLEGAPARITLLPLAAPSWDDPAKIAPVQESLRSLGFESVGNYRVEEIDGLELEGRQMALRSINAVIYERSGHGNWVDLYTHFEDGSRITFSNSGLGSRMSHEPGHEVARFEDMSVRELFEKFVAARPDKPAKAISRETFAKVFEDAYAREMDWRNSHGGAGRDAIRAIAAESGEVYDDDVIDAAHDLARRQALEDLDRAIRERFLEETKMSAVEWERVRDRVIVIHDAMTADLFEEIVGPWVDEDDFALVGTVAEETPIRVFHALNDSLPAERRFQKLGMVSSPVVADIYAVPED